MGSTTGKGRGDDESPARPNGGEPGSGDTRSAARPPDPAGTVTASTPAVDGIFVNGILIEDGDGWRVKEFEGRAPKCLALFLELKLGGELLPDYSRRVWQSSRLDDVARGEQARWKCLWEAVARFLNAGGRFSDLRDISQPQFDRLPEIEFPGFYLLGTEQELTLDSPTHTFAAVGNADRLIVWAEDASLELTTAAKEAAYRDEDGDDRENL